MTTMSATASLTDCKWYFYPVQRGPKLREPIAGEFFRTEATKTLSEDLVREAIQNSLDAACQQRVRVRICLATGRYALPASRAQKWFEGAWEHFRAKGNGLDEPPNSTDQCPFLVIEDFGTTGLTGDPEASPPCEPEAKNNFCRFFRVEGSSDKGGSDRGRWGLGKQVFALASRANAFFGLTIRSDDGRGLLMGQAVLKSHQLGGQAFQDGYYGITSDNFTLPVDEPQILKQFREDFRLTRSDEPGLSVVSPWLREEYNENDILEAVVSGYFYPILAGRLEVILEANGKSQVINRETILSIARDRFSKSAELLSLIELASWAVSTGQSPLFTLKECQDAKPKWSNQLIPPAELPKMREAFAKGEKLAVRARLQVREKGAKPESTYFDVFLWRHGTEEGRPTFVRRDLVISPQWCNRTPGVRSLVIIDDRPLVKLLGDAENPAHTEWQSKAPGLNKYEGGRECLKFVTSLPARLVAALHLPEGEIDKLALLDYFYLPEPRPQTDMQLAERAPDPGQGGDRSEHPNPPKGSDHTLRIETVSNGFVVAKAIGAALRLPARLHIWVAYDVMRGDPLAKYSPLDFQLDKAPIRVDLVGVTIRRRENNVLVADVQKEDFRITVLGFDERRDLYVKVDLEEVADDQTT
jgi:hypothetical protein